MPELSQDTIRELRRSLPILKSLLEKFSQSLHSLRRPSPLIPLEPSDIVRLERVSDYIENLTSPEQFRTWVGGSISYALDDPQKGEMLIEVMTAPTVAGETSVTVIQSADTSMITHIHSYTERLYLYVQAILKSEEIEETLNTLTQENASLKEQLAELRRRESVYLSIISKAQTSATYSLPPKSREILLDSLQRQHATLIKNLTRLQEAKAQYGLNVPLDILNAIDQTQQDLKQIEASIADLEASKTDTNRKP